MRKLSKVLALVLVLVLSVSMFAACGEKAPAGDDTVVFPERNISMIVPFGAGGGTDVYGRLVAAGMEKTIGASVPVTNTIGGTAGSTGVASVWDAKHDGYTVCATSETPLLIPVQVPTFEQTSKDWEYFVTAGSPGLIAINADSAKKFGIETIADLAAFQNKGDINIAGCSGGLWFVLAKLLEDAGWEFNWVSYAGSGPAIIAAAGGVEADIVVASAQEMQKYVKAGTLIVLANMDNEEYDGAPAISETLPSLKEKFPLRQWLGFKLPADTDPAIIAIFDKAFKAYVTSDEFIEYAENDKTEVFGYSGDEARAFVEASESKLCWTLFDIGYEGVSDPSLKGIERP